MAHQHRHRGFQSSSFSGPCLALAVVTLMCAAASTTAQQQPPPLPLPSMPLPQAQQPTTTTPAGIPSVPSLPLPQAQQPTTTTTPAGIPSVPVAACAPAQATLSPCWTYLTGNSSSPPTECCAQIRTMFQSQAPCLCAAMAAVPVQQLGSALGQFLPASCDLPANACSGGTSGAAPAADPTTPASGTTTPAAAAPVAQSNGLDDPTAAAGGVGIKSVPDFPHSAAAAGSTRGISAAALFVSVLVIYLL